MEITIDGYTISPKVVCDVTPRDGYGIIYAAYSPSGKFYIGQTSRPFTKRIARHYADAFRRSRMSKIYRAILKYKENISWEILQIVPIGCLDEMETDEIQRHDSFNNGYNSTLGGNGRRGYKLTEEQRQHLSEIRTGENNPFFGKTHSEEFSKRQSIRLKGIAPKMTPEQRAAGLLKAAKITSACIGNKHHFFGGHHLAETRAKISKTRLDAKIIMSDETKLKISESLKKISRGEDNPFFGKSHTEETKKIIAAKSSELAQRKLEEQRKIARPFLMYDEYNNVVGEWRVQTDVCRFMGWNLSAKSNISACLKGISKSHKGFTFKYKGEDKDA